MESSIDREKVLKGLRYCFATANCDGCPYEVECRKISFKTPENHCPILDDVLAMLKEQEAVKPITDNEGGYWCGSCHEDMVWHQKYCSNCGRPVKWDG